MDEGCEGARVGTGDEEYEGTGDEGYERAGIGTGDEGHK